MFIRKVLKLSFSLKNVPLSSQNVLAYHLSHVENLKGTRDIQEHVEDHGKLESDLKSSSLSKVLITLQNNRETIQGSHIATAMSTFYHVMKREASAITGDHTEPVNTEWKEHLFFKEMSDIIQSSVDKLSGPETVQILYYTTKLKGTFETHQILIEHLHKNLKDLSLEDYRLIISLFKKSERNKYLANLEKAMVKNFIMRIAMNHQKDNIDYLANGLYFLSYHSKKVDNKLLDLFFEDISNYQNDIPLEKLLIIHESLCSLHYLPKKCLELIKKIQENIMDNIDAIHPTQINYITFGIASQLKPMHGAKEFYNAAFIDKLVQRMIHDDAGFESALSILKCLINIRHYNVEILNYICASYFEKITMRSEHIANLTGKLLVVISGLAHAKYKSMFWNEVENFIMTEQSLLTYNHETLCIAALNAICLDCYPNEILKKLFDNTYDYSKDSFLHWTFAKIHQIIETNQSYEGPRPTEAQIQSLNTMFEKAIRAKRFFSALPYLEEGMGGKTYVKTNLGTKLFHIIDHVVAFDKDDLPIPINPQTNISKKTKHVEYLEDLKVPQESKIIAVIFTPTNWYFRNTRKNIGPYGVFLNTLEKLNYNVVDISYKVWKELPNKEKTSFLQSAIKSKLKTSVTRT